MLEIWQKNLRKSKKFQKIIFKYTGKYWDLESRIIYDYTVNLWLTKWLRMVVFLSRPYQIISEIYNQLNGWKWWIFRLKPYLIIYEIGVEIMLTVKECREYLGDSNLSDEQIEEFRNALYVVGFAYDFTTCHLVYCC